MGYFIKGFLKDLCSNYIISTGSPLLICFRLSQQCLIFNTFQQTGKYNTGQPKMVTAEMCSCRCHLWPLPNLFCSFSSQSENALMPFSFYVQIFFPLAFARSKEQRKVASCALQPNLMQVYSNVKPHWLQNNSLLKSTKTAVWDRDTRTFRCWCVTWSYYRPNKRPLTQLPTALLSL